MKKLLNIPSQIGNFSVNVLKFEKKYFDGSKLNTCLICSALRVALIIITYTGNRQINATITQNTNSNHDFQ